MIDSHALIHRNEKTMKMLAPRDPDLSTQMAAGTVPLAERALDVLLDSDTAAININMGCPAKKVVGCGGGSNLLRDPLLVRDMCRLVRKKTSLPFSVKFRSGWNSSLINYLEMGTIFQDEGVDFIMLHARTRAEAFSGQAHWDHIAALKKHLKIPVIGNGDIVSYETARTAFETTGCDGLAIGRGAIGNPWLYVQADRAIQGLPPAPEPSLQERYDVITEHYRYVVEHYGLYFSSHIIRKHLVGYLKGLPNHKEVKEELFSHEPLLPEILESVLQRYFFKDLIDLQKAKTALTDQTCDDASKVSSLQ